MENITSLAIKADPPVGDPGFHSTLTAKLRLQGEDKKFTLTARADNCVLLGDVVRKHLVPNLKT